MHIPSMATEPKTPLDAWMRANGRTDDTLAAELHITRSQVNRVRNGVSNPSMPTAEALRRLTGLSFDELFARTTSERTAA